MLPLPEVIPAPSSPSAGETPDVTIRFGTVNYSLEQNPRSHYLHLDANTSYMAWDQLGAMEVRNGQEIIIQPEPGAKEDILRVVTLGMCFAILLHQRGHLVLHGSAVAIGDVAAIFLGNKGQGKSTMAATLFGRDHALLTDDVVALDMNDAGEYMVVPGFPQFKLWPDAAAASLKDNPDELPPIFAGYEKRARTAVEKFANKRLPLKRVYLLSTEEAPAIRPVSPQESLLHLVTHSYSARFGQQLLHGSAASKHFMQCMDLSKKVPPRWLARHRSLEALPDVARMVEDDVAASP